MNKISIIIPCKKRLSHLLECLPNVLNQTYQDLEVIVVDFNCPENTKKVIEETFSDKRLSVKKSKVKKDYWNLSESRNFGFNNSTGSKILFLDADTILKPTFIEYAIKELTNKTFVTGLINPPYNGCGCMLINRDNFEKVKGYNEALKGWGYDDIDIYNRLGSIGLERREFNPSLIENISHDHEIRNEFHDKRNIWENCEENCEISKKEFKSSV